MPTFIQIDRYIPGGITSAVETSVVLLGNALSDSNVQPDPVVAARVAELALAIQEFRNEPAGEKNGREAWER